MATVDRFEPQALTGIAWGEITAAWLLAGVALLCLWLI
jgi:hypothetical protein